MKASNRFFLKHITALDRRLFRLERKYRAKIYKELQRQKNELIGSNGNLMTSNFESIFRELYETEGIKIFQLQYKLLDGMDKKADDFFSSTWQLWVDEFINRRLKQKIVGINDTTRKLVQEIISNNPGTPFEQLVDKLPMFNRKRAMTIARTEVAQMAVESEVQGSRLWKEEIGTGEPLYKVWTHRGAKDPRDNHVALDGVAIIETEQFQIAGENGYEAADYPHADGLSASNVVNCGCTVIYVSENYYNTRLKQI